MAAAVARIPASVTLSIGNTPVDTVVAFDVPLEVSARRTGPSEVTLTPPDGGSLGRAFAGALRQLADQVDPDVPDAPVDLDPAELEPGFVIVRCPVCDTSQAGRPGDTLEHAEDGAHVYHPAGFGA